MSKKSLEKQKNDCIDKKIPIFRDDAANYIKDLIEKNQTKSLFEIGTAHGYSSNFLALNTSLEKIISIEKDISNYQVAKSNILSNKIELINEDAFTYEPNQSFDMIFVDGPKSNQELLIEKYLSYLNNNGIMVVDNIYLKKFSDKPESDLTKNQRKLIEKLDKFRQYLSSRNVINVKFLDIGDGLAVITKK